MERLSDKLENFGLRKFIKDHRYNLCANTFNQLKMATILKFDPDQTANITAPASNFEKCSKLYELIEITTPSNFLEALEKTNNEHVIKFIESTFMETPLKRGIWFNIPHEIDSFCGRENFLSQLHDQLKPQDDSETEVTVLSQVKIVSGLGGIGKTQTARKYISQYFPFYNNFIWINSDNENSMRNSFFKLAEEIKIPVKTATQQPRELKEILKEIYNKICDDGKSNSNLIVFDNAEDYQSCQQFLPILSHPKMKKPVILATSRNQDWISPTGKIQVLPLDKMADGESLEFILKQLEIRESDVKTFKMESRKFIKLMGGLPLALQQAVAFIKQEKEERKFLAKSYKVSDYVKEFKLSMKKFLSFSPVPAPDSSPTVFVTWNVTFNKIQELENGKEAVKILEILSFLYADKIPSTFLRDLIPEIEDAEFSGALKLLEKYSMIKMNVRDFCLSLHRQLQFVILQYLKQGDDASNVVMNILDKCKLILKNIKLSKSSDIFLNILQIVNNPFDLIPMSEEFLEFMYQLGSVLYEASRYSESLELYTKVYSQLSELWGENHEETLRVQHQIALQLLQLGMYKEALTRYKEILEKQEIHPDLGVDHPQTVTTKHNMAVVLREQEKYEESLKLLQEVLAQRNKIHGENHSSTLETHNEIALVYSKLGDFPEALALYQELEKKQIEILDFDHRDVLQTKHNKACVLFEMGKIQEASKIFNEVHEKRKEILGENHLDTIDTFYWIGKTLEHEGRLTEALDIFNTVYGIRKTNCGEDHPSTIQAKYNMAAVYLQQKEYGVSLEKFQQVLAQCKRIHGKNHPETLKTQYSIASLQSEQGDFFKALDLFEQVETRQTETLGPDHRNVLTTKHNKATVLMKMGKLKEASKIFNEVHEKRKEILGEHHLDTIDTLFCIREVLEEVGNFRKSLRSYNKIYEIRRGELGEDHPSTIKVQRKIEICEYKMKYLSIRGGE